MGKSLKKHTPSIVFGIVLLLVIVASFVLWCVSSTPKPTGEMFALLGTVVGVFGIHIGHVSGHQLGRQQVPARVTGAEVVAAMKEAGWTPSPD
jgi:hypothetical protein